MIYRYTRSPKTLLQRAWAKKLPDDLEYLQKLKVNLLDIIRQYKTYEKRARFPKSRKLSGPAFEIYNLNYGLDRVLAKIESLKGRKVANPKSLTKIRKAFEIGEIGEVKAIKLVRAKLVLGIREAKAIVFKWGKVKKNPNIKQKVSDLWGRGYSLAQIQKKLNITIDVLDKDLSKLSYVILSGKFTIRSGYKPPYYQKNPMKFLTKAVIKQLPPLYSTQDQKDPIAWTKFFTPDAQWTWYVTEFDGEDLFFGLVHGMDKELGYFRMSELLSVKGPLGLSIERDKSWKPTPLSLIRSGEVT